MNRIAISLSDKFEELSILDSVRRERSISLRPLLFAGGGLVALGGLIRKNTPQKKSKTWLRRSGMASSLGDVRATAGPVFRTDS
jgi:hypothetical protein